MKTIILLEKVWVGVGSNLTGFNPSRKRGCRALQSNVGRSAAQGGWLRVAAWGLCCSSFCFIRAASLNPNLHRYEKPVFELDEKQRAFPCQVSERRQCEQMAEETAQRAFD